MNYPRPFHRHILAGISHDQFQLLSSHQTGHKEMNPFFPVAAPTTPSSFQKPAYSLETRLPPHSSTSQPHPLNLAPIAYFDSSSIYTLRHCFFELV
ncbi:hypothetical protein SLEP1_g38462 [Rubroshorea leprosula]|nr:hypothetical protein SLEP1_g38462 [Rubroshorea leprosula]